MKLPQSWAEVSIETFLKYNTILTSKSIDPIDLEIKILSLFSGKPQKEIERLKTRELSGYIKQLGFLKDLPKTKVAPYFICNSKRYRASLVMQDMRADQFMNFSEVIKGVKAEDYLYQMADLIGCMTVRRQWKLQYPFFSYEYDGYLKNAEEFRKHLPISIAYPYFVFFCKVMEKSLPLIQDSLIKETKKLMKLSQKKRWGFMNTGTGSSR